MEKLKEHKVIVSVVLIAILSAFYWTQIRPVSAKKACSWFTEVIPADAGVTKEQAEVNKKVYDEKCGTGSEYQATMPSPESYLKCLRLNIDTAEKLPRLSRESVREATKTEYDKCLRHNGL